MIHAIVLAIALAAQGPAGDQDVTAIASGRVLDAQTGRPIAGALVIVAGSAAGDATGVLANSAGHFVVRGLRKGSLALTAVKGGYVEGTYGQQRPAGSRQLVAVEAGQRLIDLDIRMWRHGVITGTVVDEAGDPVIGARVRAFQASFTAARRRYAPAGEATTDDRGVYRIAQLTPGEYVVAAPSTQTSIPTEVMDAFYRGGGTDLLRAQLSSEMRSIGAPIVPAGSEFAVRAGALTIPLPPGTATPTSRAGGAMFVYPTVFHPAAPSALLAAVVRIRPGEERGGIDLQMQMVRSVRVSGALLAPAGMAAHVGVRLVPAGGDALVNEIEAAVAMTDSTGAFEFAGVPPGQYVLTAVRVPRPLPDPADPSRITLQAGTSRLSTSAPLAPGSAPPAPIPPDVTLWTRVPIAVGSEDLKDVILPLRQGPRMSGRVEFEGSEPQPPPSAVAGLRISLEPADGSAGTSGLTFETGHPDESGRFTTYGVPPGRYIVNVTGIVFPGWAFKGARHQGRDIADTPIEMSSADVTGVVITLTDRPATLAGIVTTNGAPDPAAVVLAFPTDEDAWGSSGANPRRMKVARADRDGAYKFANLPAGEYYIAAVKDDALGDWMDPDVLRALARVGSRVTLADGEQKRQAVGTVEIRR